MVSRQIKSVFTRNYHRGGHIIASGTYPLYRIQTAGVTIGCVAQLYYGAPPSVQAVVPEWVGYFYAAVLLVGALLVLIAIQFMDETSSAARLERIGCCVFIPAVAINVATIAIENRSAPQTYATYLAVSLCVYMAIFRIPKLTKDLREFDKRRKAQGCE